MLWEIFPWELRNARFLNFESRDSATFSQVDYFVEWSVQTSYIATTQKL